jgi:hypothetical protein
MLMEEARNQEDLLRKHKKCAHAAQNQFSGINLMNHVMKIVKK